MKIFADGANLKIFKALSNHSIVQGFTTNPTLMHKAGIKNYQEFAKRLLGTIKNKTISFEVFADEPNEMAKQARIIQKWGQNVYVKIPVVNSKGRSMINLISDLQNDQIKVNITAVFSIAQLKKLASHLSGKTKSIVSIFAGRIADTGRDPIKTIQEAKIIFRSHKCVEILWASTREVFNIYQAATAHADIITVSPEILNKYIAMKNKNLSILSRETSEMFFLDAKKAGYKI